MLVLLLGGGGRGGGPWVLGCQCHDAPRRDQIVAQVLRHWHSRQQRLQAKEAVVSEDTLTRKQQYLVKLLKRARDSIDVILERSEPGTTVWMMQHQVCGRCPRELVEVFVIEPRFLHFIYVVADEEIQVGKVPPE